MSNKRYYWVFIFYTFCVSFLHAQHISSLAIPSKDSVLIGDKIELTIQVTYPKDMLLKGLDFSNYDKIANQLYPMDTLNQEKLADISFLDLGVWKNLSGDKQVTENKLNSVLSGDKYIIENKITIAIYSEGEFRIPGPDLIYDSSEEVLPAISPTIRVYLPPQMQSDSVALNPIKDIMKEKRNLSDYALFLYGLAGLLVAGLIVYYLKKRKRTVKEEVIIAEKEILPHEKALSALKLLDEQAIWQSGNIKEYQSGLTEIIRTYLEDRYHVKALEMTTDEILSSLEKTDFDRKYKSELKEILQVADLVKFAKAIPATDIHAVFMQKAVDFVIQTQGATLLGENQNTSNHD